MRRFATAFLQNPNPNLHSHAFKSKRDPVSYLFFKALSGGGSCSNVTNPEGPMSEVPMAALETKKAVEKKALRKKADNLKQEMRGTEGPLPHATIPAVKTKSTIPAVKAKSTATARPKTSGKSKKIPNVAEGLDHSLAGETVSTLVVKTGDATSGDNEKAVQIAATEKAEQVASDVKAVAKMIRLKADISQYAAQLDLKFGRQWEENTHKLLDHGISPVYVSRMLLKCRNLSCGCSVDSSLKHFLTLGMSNKEIGRVIARWPKILSIADSEFQRKVEFFESVGIDRRTLGKIVNVTPSAITNSLVVLRQCRDFWNDYMQDIRVNAFSILISKNPNLLTCGAQSLILPKIAYLDEHGFDKKMLFKYPSVLCLSLKAIASKAKLLEQFGMSSTKRRSWGLAVLHGLGIPKLRVRFKNLLALGFSLDQAQRIVLLCPGVLALREDYSHVKVSYAVNVMKLSLDALVATPTFLIHSYEKRLKYRYEVMQELITLGALEKKLSLKYLISMTDAIFISRFVERLQACAKSPDASNV